MMRYSMTGHPREVANVSATWLAAGRSLIRCQGRSDVASSASLKTAQTTVTHRWKIKRLWSTA
jgi:hypothetical protein